MTDDAAEREIETLKRKLAHTEKRAEVAEAALPGIYVRWDIDYERIMSCHLTEAGALAAVEAIGGDADQVTEYELQR